MIAGLLLAAIVPIVISCAARRYPSDHAAGGCMLRLPGCASARTTTPGAYEPVSWWTGAMMLLAADSIVVDREIVEPHDP